MRNVRNRILNRRSSTISFLLFFLFPNDSYVPHLPGAGETLRATKFQNGFGGKGANQCVAAAKLGSSTALISKVIKNRVP